MWYVIYIDTSGDYSMVNCPNEHSAYDVAWGLVNQDFKEVEILKCGYCTALGGVVLGDSCNVDGKVVPVVRD